MNQGGILTEQDRAEIVETIQRCTAGMSESQKLLVAERWAWMASELRRAVSVWQPRQHHAELPLFPEL
jgi:hypothetical protein